MPVNPLDAATTASLVAGLPDTVFVPVLFLVARDGDEACDDFDCDPLLSVDAFDDMIDALNVYFGSGNAGGIETCLAFNMIGRANVQDPDLYEQTTTVDFAKVGVAPYRVVNVIIKSESRSYVTSNGGARGIVYAREGIFPSPADPYRYSTLVHEMGHFFGLSHTWGPNNGGSAQSCTDDDYVQDTPRQLGPNGACVPPPQQPPYDTCPNDPGVDPVFNHMNYVPRECRTEFTAGQSERMDGSLVSFNSEFLLPQDDLIVLSRLTPSADLSQQTIQDKTVYVLEGSDTVVSGTLSVTGATGIIERDEVEVLPGASVPVHSGGSWTSSAPMGDTARLRQDGTFTVGQGGTLLVESAASLSLNGTTAVPGGAFLVNRTGRVNVEGSVTVSGATAVLRIGDGNGSGSFPDLYTRAFLRIGVSGTVDVEDGAAYRQEVGQVDLEAGARMTVAPSAAAATFVPGYPFGNPATTGPAGRLAPGATLEWLSAMTAEAGPTYRIEAVGTGLGGMLRIGGAGSNLTGIAFQDIEVALFGSGVCMSCQFRGGNAHVSAAVALEDPDLANGIHTTLDMSVAAPATMQLNTRDLSVPSHSKLTLDGVTARFADGRRAFIHGELEAAASAFRADAATWDGLRVEGTATLTGSLVRDVADAKGQPGAITLADGGTATISGGQVRDNNGAGVAAVGAGSSAILTEGARVQNSTGAGVLALDGGYALVVDDEVEIVSNGVGIDASGTGTNVWIHAGQISGHANGPAVRARDGARVDIWRGASGGGGAPSAAGAATLPVEISGNEGGGLYALGSSGSGGFGSQGIGGTITTASNVVCVKEPCPYTVTGQNSFVDNWQNPTAYDVRADAGATVDATQNFWGEYDPARPDSVDVSADNAASVSVYPVLPSAPSSAQSSARQGGASAASKSGGGDFEGVFAHIARADRLMLGNGPDPAARELVVGYAVAETDAEREAVLSAGVRLAARVQPPALVAWLRARTRRPSAIRPWARRALAEAYRAQGRFGDAVAVARDLADQDGAGWEHDEAAAAHRLRGLGLIVRAETERRQLVGALAALEQVAEIDGDAASEMSIGVAVAFPDADVSVMRRGGSASAKTSPTEGPAGGGDELSVWPNPTSGSVRVSVRTVPGVAVEVTVHDARGRTVATLHDGPAAGEQTVVDFDTSGLAPGVFVVRSTGDEVVAARTFTVVR